MALAYFLFFDSLQTPPFVSIKTFEVTPFAYLPAGSVLCGSHRYIAYLHSLGLSCGLRSLTMRAAVLRSRPDGPALRSIGSLATGFKASQTALPVRFPITRSLNTSSRRPLPQRPSGPTPNVSIPIRFLSDKVAAKVTVKQRPKVLAALYKTFAFCGFFVIGTGVVIVAFFLYDASTYRETPSAEDIPVSELALNPRRGGPKNLPIADLLVGDYDSDSMIEQKDKPRLVILGTGWGSIALLKNLNPGDYHVTVVSPTNYFLFTPMLPSATVGTLGLRSLVEPVRRIIDRVNGHFLKASATDVEFSHKLVEVSQVDQDGNTKNFYLPYDKLVIGVGTCDNPEETQGQVILHGLLY
jgi:NADH dehydrogenase